MSLCPMGFFRAIENKYWNKHNVNEHNMAKNSNWQEVDQLASYKFVWPRSWTWYYQEQHQLLVRLELEPATSRFQLWHPTCNFSAMLPPKCIIIVIFLSAEKVNYLFNWSQVFGSWIFLSVTLGKMLLF